LETHSKKGFNMSSKFVSALAAVALTAAPTIAAAQSAAPAPAQESVEGSELRGGGGVGQVLPLFIIIAIVLLIREIVKDRDLGREDPRSP
jgi:hypothetical protein